MVVTGIADGIQNNGTASKLQPTYVQMLASPTDCHGNTMLGLTNGDPVADGAKSTHVERRILDELTSPKHRGEDRDSVADSKEDDTNTTESVESSRRAEINAAECDLHDHAQHHGIERQAQRRVDLLPPMRARNCAVSGEGPGASGRSRGAPDTADYAEYDKWDGKRKGATLAANSRYYDGWDRLSRRVVEQCGNVWHHIHQWDEEGETSDQVKDDCSNQSFRDLRSWLSHFFTHTAAELANDGASQGKKLTI